MPYTKMKRLEEKFGDLHQIIPELANKFGQYEAAKQLGISVATVNHWLRNNGYVAKIEYIKDEFQEEQS